MTEDKKVRDILTIRAFEYLEKNAERFTKQEKAKFLQDFNEYLSNSKNFITDEVYDFLTTINPLMRTRESEFVSYLNGKYKNLRFGKVCDVGSGRLCKMSIILSNKGNQMYAIDPNIRISQSEATKLGIRKISKDRFVCDKFASHEKGTNISHYDMILGLEPCGATEHIIHQSLKYEKPFNILLCYEAHQALNGKTFRSPEEWFEYLSKISSEVELEKVKNNYFATNVKNQKVLSNDTDKTIQPEL